MDTHVRSRAKSIEIDSVASFVEHVNNTVGKHFRCCICFRSVGLPVLFFVVSFAFAFDYPALPMN